MTNTKNNNTGDWNTGYRNTGYRNTGDYNTGYRNTGDYNTGDWNTGDWNTGDYNTGYCNTITPDDILIFNKPSSRKVWGRADKPSWIYVSLTNWIAEYDMSDKEKDAYPSYVTTGGYLKCYSDIKVAYREAWEKADAEDRAKTFKLPNFDAEVFEEIFGFNPNQEKKYHISVGGQDIEVSKDELNKIRKSLNDQA